MADDPKTVAADEAAQAAAVSAEHAIAATDQAAKDDAAATKAAGKAAPPCPHCGRKLRAENDLGGHLHCDGINCIGCCFDPGDPPMLRAGHLICPAA